MDDLISRQAAIAAVGYYSLHSGDKLLFADAPLKALPTVDPVKHGRWKKAYADHEAFGERPFYRYCSECCEVTVFPFKFCPNCGARMDEEADHDDHL